MLYAIGDLHLSFGAEKPMDIFGAEWEGHTEKLKRGFSKLAPDDVCVICGDLTWGMDMDGCLEDFRFIDALPGKKIILKGNHDFWWSTATKAKDYFAAHGITTIDILNNNCFFYEDAALCGTRGWTCVLPQSEHDRKMMQREIGRLETSLAAADGAARKLCFLHYPPIFGKYRADGLIGVMQRYGVAECCYGHVHGKGRPLAYEGGADGIVYRLVAADNLGFEPLRIL